MRQFLTILIFILSQFAFAQNENNLPYTKEDIQKYMEENPHRVLTEEEIELWISNNNKIENPQFGPEGKKFINSFRLNPMADGIVGFHDTAKEAAEAGWGSSIWDKGHYYPGMDVEAVRAFYRKEFFKNLAIIFASIIAACGIGYGIYILIKNRKKTNKESSKELLIYYKSTKPRHSDRTESSGPDQGNYQPS